MAEDTICVPISFFKDLNYNTKKLSHLADQLDVLAYELRQVHFALDRIQEHMD